MTLRDITEQSIEIQGNVTVKKWIEEKNDYKILAETESTIFPEKVLDREIKYMWAIDNTLVIEVE